MKVGKRVERRNALVQDADPALLLVPAAHTAQKKAYHFHFNEITHTFNEHSIILTSIFKCMAYVSVILNRSIKSSNFLTMPNHLHRIIQIYGIRI